GSRRIGHGGVARRGGQRGHGRTQAARGAARRHAAHAGQRLVRHPGQPGADRPGLERWNSERRSRALNMSERKRMNATGGPAGGPNGPVNGQADGPANDTAEHVPDVAALLAALDATGYPADQALAPALFLAARM